MDQAQKVYRAAAPSSRRQLTADDYMGMSLVALDHERRKRKNVLSDLSLVERLPDKGAKTRAALELIEGILEARSEAAEAPKQRSVDGDPAGQLSTQMQGMTLSHDGRERQSDTSTGRERQSERQLERQSFQQAQVESVSASQSTQAYQ